MPIHNLSTSLNTFSVSGNLSEFRIDRDYVFEQTRNSNAADYQTALLVTQA